MTTHTGVHRLFPHRLQRIAVAVAAFDLRMRSPESESGMVVVEAGLRRRQGLRCITAAVITMAVDALRPVEVAVKAFPRLDKVFDGNVTGQTQTVRRAFEVHVAAFALALEFGVFRVQWSG